jgi:K+-sensing histidine kinase KdpD
MKTPETIGFGHESRQRAQVRMLHALAGRLNTSAQIEQIGEAVTSELGSLIDYHNCRVYLLEPNGVALVPIAFKGDLTEYQGETFEALVTTVGTGITGHVAAVLQSHYAPNARTDEYGVTIPGTPELDESVLAAPMVFGERLTGVVVLSKLGVDQFDGEDLRVLEIVASHAAVAVENARSRAELERALHAEREATRRLQGLDEMKDTFLQAVSHDLRTPLTAVMGIALTLEREELALSAEDRRDLNSRLASNARKLDRLLSNLLDVERLLRGVVEASRQMTDVGALVRSVFEEADLRGPERIHVDARTLVADIDGPKVERIIENLLVNAARHTPDGTPIWVRVEPSPDGILLVVDDAGPGVPDEFKEVIFEPFRQGPVKQASPGTGIGLSLVARFAELHGGRAWVEDRDGGGASFRAFLPCTVLGRSTQPLLLPAGDAPVVQG